MNFFDNSINIDFIIKALRFLFHTNICIIFNDDTFMEAKCNRVVPKCTIFTTYLIRIMGLICRYSNFTNNNITNNISEDTITIGIKLESRNLQSASQKIRFQVKLEELLHSKNCFFGFSTIRNIQMKNHLSILHKP